MQISSEVGPSTIELIHKLWKISESCNRPEKDPKCKSNHVLTEQFYTEPKQNKIVKMRETNNRFIPRGNNEGGYA